VLVCVCGLGVVGGGLGVDGEGEVVGLQDGFVEGEVEVGVWVEEVGEDAGEVGAVAEGCAEHLFLLSGVGDGDGGGRWMWRWGGSLREEVWFGKCLLLGWILDTARMEILFGFKEIGI